MPRKKAKSQATATPKKPPTTAPAGDEATAETSEVLPLDDTSAAAVETVEAEVLEEGKELLEEPELSPLTPEQQARREELESEVWASFRRAGEALREIREQKLYRSTHTRFEDYCADTYSYTKRYPYYLIDAATSTDNIEAYLKTPEQQERLDELQQSERAVHLLPLNEYQLRPLKKLPAEEQGAAWVKALERTQGSTPSHALVQEIVNELRLQERQKKLKAATKSLATGRICRLKPHGWGIVKASNKQRTELELWNGQIELVDTTKVKELPLEIKQRNRYKKLQKTLADIAAAEDLEQPALLLLNYFGQRISGLELTELESELLGALEKTYIS